MGQERVWGGKCLMLEKRGRLLLRWSGQSQRERIWATQD